MNIKFMPVRFRHRFWKETTTLREVIEDTLDWMATRCGVEVAPRAPRALRQAVRSLTSQDPVQRQAAEARLLARRREAVPMLRLAASVCPPMLQAVRAALLLHRLHPDEGREMLRHLAHERHLRQGATRGPLRQAVRELIGPPHYVRLAAENLALLEQRPESCRAVARYRQALEVLRFIAAPLPLEIARRALVVRTVGGEDLGLVRAVLAEGPSSLNEHICMARRETVECLLHDPDRARTFTLLGKAVGHPSPTVKLTALDGLCRLGYPEAIPLLLPIACDADSPVQADAREVIAQLKSGTPDALTLLRGSQSRREPLEHLLRPPQRG